MRKWFVYILRCADSSLYTGMTDNLEKRLKTHNRGKGAKYTRSRLPVVLVYTQEFDNWSEAARQERNIKKLSKHSKEFLVKSTNPIK